MLSNSADNASSIRINAKKVADGTIEVKVLIKHPMESGFRKDLDTGKLIPAHFVEEVICEHNDKVIMKATLSGAVSINPYLAFKFKEGQLGDIVRLSWRDNKEGSGETSTTIVKADTN